MCEVGAGDVPPPVDEERPSYKPRFLEKDPHAPSESLGDASAKQTPKLWKYSSPVEPPTVLHPDDPLMKRFQDSLKSHLTRINNKLQDEIYDLEIAIKRANEEREQEGLKLYSAQEEIARQQSTIEKYQATLTEVIQMREEKESQINTMKEVHREAYNNLRDEKSKEEEMTRELESLASLERQFTEWENELSSNITVSKRMSEKDAVVQRELIQKKQQEDYILFKIMSEVWKLESEIKMLNNQAELKEKEKAALHQTITDANADLDALQREYKNLFNTWNSVVANVSQRNKIYSDICNEKQQIRESFRTLQSGIDKLKKETNKEMETNERLTAVQSRLEDEIQMNLRMNAAEREKITHLESQLSKIVKLIEQNNAEFNDVQSDYQYYENIKQSMQKDIEKLANQKVQLEDQILLRLEEKVTHDKAAKHLNKVLRDLKCATREQELIAAQAENSYGKTLLDIEKLNTILDNNKSELQELDRANNAREKEIDTTQSEIRKIDIVINKKQRELVMVNKKIEEAIEKTGGEDISPLDSSIITLEKNIEEAEQKIQKSQLLWLRQEGYMVNLTQQRNVQSQEMSLLAKQITITEQKNLKLETELEEQRREEINMNRVINNYQQKLVHLNSRLAMQKDYKDLLEDTNVLTKNEYLKSLEELEMDIVRLKNDIQQLEEEKISLKEQLNSLQRESLSWEKKVQLAQETNKNIKDEQGCFGDVGIMKSEIQRMQIRLSHLRKAQEKLVLDMEHCVSRRDAIVDGAMAKEKRNPKGQHNQRMIFRKRLDDQRLKIKQVTKETKQIENQISELEKMQKTMLEQLNQGQEILRSIEDAISETEKEIVEVEIIKQHNLELLIRKQHKVKMYQEMQSGSHKMLYKSESLLNAEFSKQRIMNSDLREIIEQTQNDFPLLNNATRKILLTLQTP
ncbi:coiled-coil domain-containing protein 40 [Athalia rosae]|uniref:coiled-coil domain-containing protein 40 n=1 Tax=Athalia rosae TaxID=37344 RepID=UPI002033C6B7|nr:coiled-coil domain-containing protein 40 [Athalia rosae]XP_048515562.1 coiled-coil domain-containing protein 40 [Athalia rosae]